MPKFLLNSDKICNISSLDANTTILEYLRANQLNGTKEGCASGDCGACTVVIAELGDQASGKQKLHYKSMNSCIGLLSQLAGKQLITVEGLQTKNELHPVQQAMVENHGSQCGYCTPGFIMSLFALSKNSSQIDKPQILEALGGNLCRCTSYRPIIDAGLKLRPHKDKFEKASAQTMQTLQKIQEKKLTFYPENIKDLSACYKKYPQAKLVCGGTDLMLAVTQNHNKFEGFIHLDRVRELNLIQENTNSIFIGSTVCLTKVSSFLQKYFPSFTELFDRFASLQIRNQASLGGNLAHSSAIADTPPALLVLEASVFLRKEQKTRKILLQDFFVGYRKTCLQPQEFIEKIEIPKPQKNSIFCIFKVSKRAEDDISALCGAFSLKLDKEKKIKHILIAFCGMAPFPKLATKTQNFLQGKKWECQNIVKAGKILAQDYQPITDLRATKEYREQVCKNLLFKFYLENQ